MHEQSGIMFGTQSRVLRQQSEIMLGAVQSVFMHFEQSLIIFSQRRGDGREGDGREGGERVVAGKAVSPVRFRVMRDTYNEGPCITELCRLVVVLLVGSGLDGRR